MKETLTDDVRIQSLRPLLPPAILMEEVPCSDAGLQHVTDARRSVSDVLGGRDQRLVVVVGPCSIHHAGAGLEYAGRLQETSKQYSDQLLVVMRTYFEKPRTTIGWKGLINDPRLDNSFAINHGLRVARGFLRDVVELGLPTGTEFLDPISPQFIADLVAWGAIGARTVESQVHRELASGLSMPVGFKNGTGGSVQIAVDAIRSAQHPHRFLSVTKQGLAAIVETTGNPDCHVILRGGGGSPNYSAEHVQATAQRLDKAQVCRRIMIDCSHSNSGKDPSRQPLIAQAVADQIAAGPSPIFGVMLESFLVGGRQEHSSGQPLAYGQSITDGCMSWDETVPVLNCLAEAVVKQRSPG